MLQGELKRAINEFEQALQIDPQQQYAQNYLRAAKEKIAETAAPLTDKSTTLSSPHRKSAGSSSSHSSTLPSTYTHSSSHSYSSSSSLPAVPRVPRDRSSSVSSSSSDDDDSRREKKARKKERERRKDKKKHHSSSHKSEKKKQHKESSKKRKHSHRDKDKDKDREKDKDRDNDRQRDRHHDRKRESSSHHEERQADQPYDGAANMVAQNSAPSTSDHAVSTKDDSPSRHPDPTPPTYLSSRPNTQSDSSKRVQLDREEVEDIGLYGDEHHLHANVNPLLDDYDDGSLPLPSPTARSNEHFSMHPSVSTVSLMGMLPDDLGDEEDMDSAAPAGKGQQLKQEQSEPPSKRMKS